MNFKHIHLDYEILLHHSVQGCQVSRMEVELGDRFPHKKTGTTSKRIPRVDLLPKLDLATLIL